MRKKSCTKWLGGTISGFILLVLPFILEKAFSQYDLYLAIKIMVWALYAMSFNLVLGYGGMMSFGHAAFFGVGAYTCSLLLVKASCPFSLAMAAAPFAAAAVGLIIGFFSVRIKGVFYFAILTLSFAQLVYILAFKWRSFTFGDDGIQGIPVPEMIATDETHINYYFFSLIILLICIYILWRIVKSPFGLMLRSLRENPERATFVGMNVENYRLIAFVISAFFSGMAGVLSAGDMKRLELGIVLATKPNLLLLDEPTCGMSPVETTNTIDLIQEIAKKKSLTVLFTEHKMDVVFSIASYITVMNFGSVIAAGKPDDIRSNEQVQKIYFGETRVS